MHQAIHWRRLIYRHFLSVAIAAVASTQVCAQGTAGEIQFVSTSSSLPDDVSREGIEPLIKTAEPGGGQPQGVDWSHLVRDSLFFASVEHAFRCATEQGTRDAFGQPFFPGYLDAVGNLHGWGDGDPFYVNYIGHPMQGAVSGYIWAHNDRAYRDIVFGKDPQYWKGKLRSVAFSYVYSVLFEIGPFSEASIGNIQAYYPAQGFVDHVVTPAIGSGWSITEDTLDRYLVGLIEARTTNRWFRLLARSGLNPARSMANVMTFSPPWHRDNRSGIESYRSPVQGFVAGSREPDRISSKVTPPLGVAPFEFALAPQFRTYLGNGQHGSCAGGGGSGALRLASQWQMVVDVSGCKLLGLETNLSGDSLSYMAGTRRTFRPSNRWSAHAQLLIGGTKLTQERIYPELKQALDLIAKHTGGPVPPHSAYSQHWETNGFTIQAAGGVDLKLNNALSVRMGNIGYFHSWSNNLNGFNYQNGLQVTSGLILRMGTW